MSSAVAKTSFDKYAAYSKAVQVPKNEARFLRSLYKELNGTEPQVLREDFCGTFAICCEWVKLDSKKRAIGLDIDPEPLAYGTKHYLPKLTESQRKRVKALERDVLGRNLLRSDLICALNFSYFAFHARDTLVQYFRSCRRSLQDNGLFVVDTFGGPQHSDASLDTRKLPGLVYYFEQEHFDPINNRTKFNIHFKPGKSRRKKRAFSYDWRMWSIPEIRDAMLDAGFSSVDVYWEGTARDGRGSGRFTRKRRGESCLVWVAYVVGRK